MVTKKIKQHIPYCNSSLSYSSHNYCNLLDLIKQKRLSDCLECLEKAGYTGDTAVFMLAFIQGGIA